MRSNARPITSRSKVPIAAPATAPARVVLRPGRQRASTTPHPHDNVMWTGTAAATSGTRRVSFGNTMDPAASVAAHGSAPVSNA